MERRAIVVRLSDELGVRKSDEKFIGRAYNHVVNIKHTFSNGFLLTDFFLPEYMDCLNDYIYYGFLIVTDGNIEYIDIE